MLIIINEQLALAHPLADGRYSWTLATRLGQLLRKAESEYGTRDRSFTILGVEFRPGPPRIWFPGDCGHVAVQLSVDAMQNPILALFQLAHECVHLLDPAPGPTNWLEEGAATAFSLDFMRDELGIADYSAGDCRYEDAASLVRELLATRADAIRILRRRYGPLRALTACHIRDVAPELTEATARRLLEVP